MSQKPAKAPTEDKQKRKRKRKRKQTLTRAVTHIRLLEANTGKLEALDALVTVYLELCQRYTTLFCQAECTPDKWGEPVFATELSDRLHRVAMRASSRDCSLVSEQSSPSLSCVSGRSGSVPAGQGRGRSSGTTGLLQAA
jgi:hypothetical protein